MKKPKKVKVYVYSLSKKAEVELIVFVEDGDKAEDIASRKSLEMANNNQLDFVDTSDKYLAVPHPAEDILLN